jgi:hypothetical protein
MQVLALIAKRVFIGMVVLLCLLYTGDYLSVRYRIPNNREPFEEVKTNRYYAIPQKDGKTEFAPAPPMSQTCVHSLFPHAGDSPCWYVYRHLKKRIDM